jgi:predicted aspartyl protease
LIDTGASCTCLDPTVIASLGLPPTGLFTIAF